MPKIAVEIDPLVADDHEFAAIVEVELMSGRREAVRVDVASGKPGNWLSEELLKEKFFDCLGADRATSHAASHLFSSARSLSSQPSVAVLYESLVQVLGHPTGSST